MYAAKFNLVIMSSNAAQRIPVTLVSIQEHICAVVRELFTSGTLTPKMIIGLSTCTPSLNTYSSSVNFGFYLTDDSSVQIFELL